MRAIFVYIPTKMAVVIDFTKQPVYTEFSNSSQEDISYATNFWQSIQLHPPMESRLVSSDIKQRLKVAPPSSQARNIAHSVLEDQPKSAAMQDFLTRAKTMEHVEENSRLQKFIEAKVEDKLLLQKQRDIRKKKEEISRNKGISKRRRPDKDQILNVDEYEHFENEETDDALKQIAEFEQTRFGQATAEDSD